ncbi:addiction module antidote protein [Thiorhodovibrio frisius]|uniref:Putative addiction module antidote protein n=1 Tax=Thiorhodovibrio frisius TaxID=631362 RepID=H8Z6S4_9GAMM|nr:addiction module antidote protein [Thiorhodovibrio frisius]EIC20790.1 putative addiction module antidote protein [Thiorhodovibrio frisius]WPL21841.1 putative addiction module antidote protein [Thiorhodovibrio frisius]
MTERFTRWDSADYLETEEDIRLYLEACIEEDPGDGSLIRSALGDIARARNFSALAREVGVTREGLRKALSADGNPSFALVLKMAHALGLGLELKPRAA